MNNENRRELEWIDELIQDIRGKIAIYQLVSPENETIEKERFERSIRENIARNTPESTEDILDALEEISIDDLTPEELENLEIRNPGFTYDVHEDYSSEKIQIKDAHSILASSEASESLKQLYNETLDELESLIDIAENIGEPEPVQEASRKIYGEPSEEALDWARETLEDVETSTRPEPVFSAEDLKSSVEAAIELIGMEDWSVEYTQKGSVSVNGANREIRVPEDRKYTENEMMRLLTHEVGTHTLRSANGYLQEFGVMGSGTGKYHVTEEGLALFMEEETGLSSQELKRKYAGRVLAVQSVIEGDDFNDTYLMARKNSFNHDNAWNLATRAHRAGGFIKDHIYAEGLAEISEYVDEHGSINPLMIGKISSEHAEPLEKENLKAEYSPGDIVRNLDELTPAEVDASKADIDNLLKYLE